MATGGGVHDEPFWLVPREGELAERIRRGRCPSSRERCEWCTLDPLGVDDMEVDGLNRPRRRSRATKAMNDGMATKDLSSCEALG